jgi:hypothetical protein
MGFHTISPLYSLKDRFGNPCIAPFDPHDLRYYLSTSPIHKEFKNFQCIGDLGNGHRVEVKNEKVLWMDDHGLETIRKMKIPYYQTKRDSECELFVE